MVWNLLSSTSAQYLIFISLVLLWSLGGYLIARSRFSISARESLPGGLGIGFLLMIVLTNLASFGLNLIGAYLVATLMIFCGGVALAVFSPLKREIFQGWRHALAPLLVFLFLFVLFLRINQGLGIFDESYNLPIVSRIAAGDAPPHFPFDPTQPLAYHYGLHLMAGVAVRLGRISPWLAFDAVRAFTHALMLALAFLWFERKVGRAWSAIIGAAVVYFGGSTQWLVLLAPPAWVQKLSSIVTLSNTALATGKDLYDVFVRNWNIDGLGVVSLPFAFIGGIFKPQNLALTSNGASVALTVFLLLLLEPKRWQLANIAILSLLLASLALTAEYLFGLIALGMGLSALLLAWRERKPTPLVQLAALWIPASALALFAGGVISVMGQNYIQGLKENRPILAHGSLGFEAYFPPSLPTLYFGRLSLFQLDTLLFAVLLLGPMMLLIPLSLWQLKSQAGSMHLIEYGLLSGAGICFLLSLVIGIEDSLGGITRLLDAALLILLIFAFPILHNLWEKRSRSFQTLIALGLLILSIGGIATFCLELLAIARPQYTTYITDLDVRFYAKYWDRLPPQAQVFDPTAVRSIVIFGRPIGAIATDYGRWLPEWLQLLRDPSPMQLVQNGYTHAYLDKRFWRTLEKSDKAAWEQRCVRLLHEENLDFDFRRLYDLQDCR